MICKATLPSIAACRAVQKDAENLHSEGRSQCVVRPCVQRMFRTHVQGIQTISSDECSELAFRRTFRTCVQEDVHTLYSGGCSHCMFRRMFRPHVQKDIHNASSEGCSQHAFWRTCTLYFWEDIPHRRKRLYHNNDARRLLCKFGLQSFLYLRGSAATSLPKVLVVVLMVDCKQDTDIHQPVEPVRQ